MPPTCWRLVETRYLAGPKAGTTVYEMACSTHTRNIAGITAYAQEKRQRTKRTVDEPIRQLVKSNENITFNRVAILSGVSKSYLYTCAEVRERIESLREQQTGQTTAQRVMQLRTATGRDVLLVAKDRPIKELEAENQRLKAQLKVALGKIYEQR
jgi:translation elongation factor EF-Ts